MSGEVLVLEEGVCFTGDFVVSFVIGVVGVTGSSVGGALGDGGSDVLFRVGVSAKRVEEVDLGSSEGSAMGTSSGALASVVDLVGPWLGSWEEADNSWLEF